MANLSTTTRKDQVLRYLQRHDDWVDGPELANAQVGGSEGLKRVRELRAEGHRIITRPHPDRSRDVFQYKLIKPESINPVVQSRLDEMMPPFVDAVCPRCGATAYVPLPAQCRLGHPDTEMVAAQVPSSPKQEAPALADPPEPPPPILTPGMAGREFLLRRNDDGLFELTKEVCVECGGLYDDDLEHRTTDARHLRWIEAQQQETIGVPEQPPPYKFTVMPHKIEMGKVIPCPRCGGKRRLARSYYSRKKGVIVEAPAEDFTRDPFKPTLKGQPNLCARCGGFGVIPQYVDDSDVVQPIREP